MATKNMLKYEKQFHCECCDYKCSTQFCWNQHLSTRKHKNATNCYIDATNKYECTCGKKFNHHSSLFRHKKQCEKNHSHDKPSEDLNNVSEMKIFIIDLMNENKELRKMIQDMIPKIGNGHIITSNSHNKTFNLQVFLNETCKDAMNINDFVESLQIQISDLENVGKVGYVDGITEIIVKNLKALDVSKRPVHCTDLKREVLYVKDENKWEKDTVDKDKLRKAIKQIAHKNIKMIPAWKELNPKYVLDEGKANDEYIQIVMKSMGGSDKAQDISYENKIISKLAKSVMIDKDVDLIC